MMSSIESINLKTFLWKNNAKNLQQKLIQDTCSFWQITENCYYIQEILLII